jgi:biopolymer transport protein ExbD
MNVEKVRGCAGGNERRSAHRHLACVAHHFHGHHSAHSHGLTLWFSAQSKQARKSGVENKTVVVQVLANKLKINEDTTWDGLGPRLETIFKERAEKIAFVKGDNDVLFMEVARAIDVMRGAGIDRVGLITAKLEAGQ